MYEGSSCTIESGLCTNKVWVALVIGGGMQKRVVEPLKVAASRASGMQLEKGRPPSPMTGKPLSSYLVLNLLEVCVPTLGPENNCRKRALHPTAIEPFVYFTVKTLTFGKDSLAI